MAADTIDDLGDAAADAGARASRKRHLLNGPEEFNRVRLVGPSSEQETPGQDTPGAAGLPLFQSCLPVSRLK
jgi:hypothetical protein